MANQAARGKFQLMFLGEPDALRRSFAQVDRKTVAFNREIDRKKARLATFGIGLTGALLAFGKGLLDVAKAANDAQVSDARLQAQTHAMGISFQKVSPQINAVVQRLSKQTGLDDEDVEDAFTNILRVTGKVTESERLVGLATDIARAKHLGVAKAGELVGKVAGGNVGILSRYGIKIRKNATSAQALAILSRKFKGQGEAYGSSLQGAYDRFDVATENLKEAIGQQLLPVIVDMAEYGIRVVHRVDVIVSHLGDTTDSVKAWANATVHQGVAGITGLPGEFKDGALWIVGQVFAGLTLRKGVIRDAGLAVVTGIAGQLKTLFNPKTWLGIAGDMITGLVKGLGKQLVDKLVGTLGGAAKLVGDFVSAKALGGIGLGGPFGKNAQAKWLTIALMITHHFSAANLRALYGRMIQESGGNPRAINLWDSNAKAGHPSKGLLQTIDSTFAKYHLPGHDDIWNPIDNAIAAIRYMYAVYGHIVGPSNSGYAAGGEFIAQGFYPFMVGEKGPELVSVKPAGGRRVLTIPYARIASALDAHAHAHRIAFQAA